MMPLDLALVLFAGDHPAPPDADANGTLMARRRYGWISRVALLWRPQLSLNCSTYSPTRRPDAVTDLVLPAGTVGATRSAFDMMPTHMPGCPGTGVTAGSLLDDMSKGADIGSPGRLGATLVISVVEVSAAGAREVAWAKAVGPGRRVIAS